MWCAAGQDTQQLSSSGSKGMTRCSFGHPDAVLRLGCLADLNPPPCMTLAHQHHPRCPRRYVLVSGKKALGDAGLAWEGDEIKVGVC